MLGEMHGVLLGDAGLGGGYAETQVPGCWHFLGVACPHGVAGTTVMGATSVIFALRLGEQVPGEVTNSS